MNISLTKELEKLVHEKVKSGLYNSASEVIRDALRLLTERDEAHRMNLERLRREVQIGIDQANRGMVKPLDMEAIKARARARLKSRKSK